MNDIDNTMQRCGSRADFIRRMKRKGYEITWTDERKYITFTCPHGMKCRDNKLHDEKYLKENIEYALALRERLTAQLNAGYADEKERELGERVGNDTVSTDSLRDTAGAERTGAGTVRELIGNASRDVSALRYARNPNGTDELSESDVGYSGGLYQPSGEIFGSRESKNGSRSEGEHRTGWEESRAVYLESLVSNGKHYQQTGRFTHKNPKMGDRIRHRNVSSFDPAFGYGLSALASAGELIEDPEDKEERRKRIEAQQSGQALGAIVGAVIGVAFALAQENESASEEEMQEDFVIKL